MGWDVLPRVGGEGCSIVSPTDSLAPNMDAIQQTLVDTDSEDGRPLLQLEPPPEDVISALEADLVGNVAWDPISAVTGPRHQGASRRVALVPQSSQGTPRSIQDRESLCTPVSLSNRFAALDENSRPEVHVMSEGADEAASTASDTESLAREPRIRRRRSSLVWDVGSNPHLANQSGESVPDSHEDRLARVRLVVQEERMANIQQRQVLVAEEFIRSVVSRVGPVRRSQDEIPRSLRRQQWSALKMWAAAEGDRDCGVFRWLRSRA